MDLPLRWNFIPIVSRIYVAMITNADQWEYVEYV